MEAKLNKTTISSDKMQLNETFQNTNTITLYSIQWGMIIAIV